MWRAGANSATKVTFNKDVTFAGKPVPAGSYAFFVIPGKSEWTVILNKKADQPGAGRDYKSDQICCACSSSPRRPRSASGSPTWSPTSTTTRQPRSRVGEAAAVDSDRAWHGDAGGGEHPGRRRQHLAHYANAARYMLENKKDFDAGLKYIDQSLALKEDWFNLWIKAQLLAAKKNFKEAYALADKSNQLGQKAGPGSSRRTRSPRPSPSGRRRSNWGDGRGAAPRPAGRGRGPGRGEVALNGLSPDVAGCA